MYLKRLMILLGFHGERHNISKMYLNSKSYSAKYNLRLKKLLKWAHNNGLGI